MPPKACVITAVVTCDQDTQARLEPLRTSNGTIRTSIDRAAAAIGSDGGSAADSSSSSSRSSRPSRGVTRGGVRYTTSGTAPTRSSLAASSSQEADGTSSSSSEQQQPANAASPKALHQLSKHLQAAFPSSSRGPSLPDAWASFLQQVLGGSSSSSSADLQEDFGWEDVLVGVAEVSFDSSTRSSNGSVEPPNVSGAAAWCGCTACEWCTRNLHCTVLCQAGAYSDCNKQMYTVPESCCCTVTVQVL
jgi:hypothetical protein